MITHETKKTVQSSRSKIIAITHRVKKIHRQINHLDKFSQNNWFSRHTLKISGKFLNFFDKPSGRGRFSSILSEKRSSLTFKTSRMSCSLRFEQLSSWVSAITNWLITCTRLLFMYSKQKQEKEEVLVVECSASLKNTANGGGMWRFFWLLEICLSWLKNGHLLPTFQLLLRSNQAMKSRNLYKKRF